MASSVRGDSPVRALNNITLFLMNMEFHSQTAVKYPNDGDLLKQFRSLELSSRNPYIRALYKMVHNITKIKIDTNFSSIKVLTQSRGLI